MVDFDPVDVLIMGNDFNGVANNWFYKTVTNETRSYEHKDGPRFLVVNVRHITINHRGWITWQYEDGVTVTLEMRTINWNHNNDEKEEEKKVEQGIINSLILYSDGEEIMLKPTWSKDNEDRFAGNEFLRRKLKLPKHIGIERPNDWWWENRWIFTTGPVKRVTFSHEWNHDGYQDDSTGFLDLDLKWSNSDPDREASDPATHALYAGKYMAAEKARVQGIVETAARERNAPQNVVQEARTAAGNAIMEGEGEANATQAGKEVVDAWADKVRVQGEVETEASGRQAPQNVIQAARTAAGNAMTQGEDAARQAGEAVVDKWEAENYAEQDARDREAPQNVIQAAKTAAGTEMTNGGSIDAARQAGEAVVDQWVQDKEAVVNYAGQYASEAPQNVRDEAKTAAENAMMQGRTMDQARNAGKAVVDQWESQYAAQLMEAPPIPEGPFDVNQDQSITKDNPHSRGGYADIFIDQLFLPSGKMIFTYEDGTVHTFGPFTKNQQNQYCFHGCKDRNRQEIGHQGASQGGYEFYLYTNAPPFKCRFTNYDLRYTTGHNTLKSVEFKDGSFGGVHINWYNMGSIPPKDNTEYLNQIQDQRLAGLTIQLSVSNAHNTTISDLVNTVITGSQGQLLSVGNALSVARTENTQLSVTKRQKTTERNDEIEGRISAQSMALTTLQTGAGGKQEVDNRYISVSTTLSVAKTQFNELSVQLLSVQKAISDKTMLGLEYGLEFN